MRLHFREYGKGTPLVILHGLFGSLDNWHTLSRRLAAQFHVFAVDQRNHGRSPHCTEMNYSLMAEDLIGFFRERSIASAHLLGHSMGGKTAMEFALTFPEKVSKLIVVDIAPRAYGPAHGEIFNALLSVNLQSFQTRREIEAALAPAVPELRVRRFLLKNLARDPAGAFYWKLDLQNIFQNYSSLNAAIAPDRLFEKPARFLRGGRSDYIQEQDFAAIRRLFPCADICAIRDAGHWVHDETPDALVESVEHFLGKPAPG